MTPILFKTEEDLNLTQLEANTSFFMVFSKKSVMKCDISDALKRLNHFTASQDAFCKFEGCMRLTFDGWDHDQRELFQIPECRRFMEKLGQAWPYFYYFLVPNDSSGADLYSVLRCFESYQPPRVSINTKLFDDLLQHEDNALLELCKSFVENQSAD
ncbi:hypothetical protein [Flavobacterium sp.]|uniref:hypothetical protein n=1 Tax=Flavobacterium sp. TaxID=239 RepID=UPI002610BBF8|nr:hypothetical protein [Flavobacterium sp.]